MVIGCEGDTDKEMYQKLIVNKNILMKKILKKKVDNLDFYKIFKPELTPKRMMELGVFGGAYFGWNIKEYPKSWFKNAKISKTFDVNLNKFKVVSGLSREHWIEKGMDF